MWQQVRLGFNVDHVAVLRQARRGGEPDPLTAAQLGIIAGAHQITVHLRGDRRHIQERDLELLVKLVKVPVNLEMAATKEMIHLARTALPAQATLVPERAEELTTEGGLDVALHGESLRTSIYALKNSGIAVSLFLDADLEQIKAGYKLGVDAIEINTGRYADAPGEAERAKHLTAVREAAKAARKLGLKVFAGHGLNYRNVRTLVAIEEIEEFNIGQAIVARAVYVGIPAAVSEMVGLLRR
jgi:pyridoxine 5-phosphate synthase